MTKNIGSTDRTVRIVVGAIVAIVGVVGILGYIALPMWLNIVLIVVGAVVVVTALIRFCGLYKLLGINTCKCGDCSCGEASCATCQAPSETVNTPENSNNSNNVTQ